MYTPCFSGIHWSISVLSSSSLSTFSPLPSPRALPSSNSNRQLEDRQEISGEFLGRQQPACQLISKPQDLFLDTYDCVVLCVRVRLCACVAESSHVAVETAWENSLSETLEKEVQDTRKMVSALQVDAYWGLSLTLVFLKNVFLLTSKLKL